LQSNGKAHRRQITVTSQSPLETHVELEITQAKVFVMGALLASPEN
jgi:hypothetical protein